MSERKREREGLSQSTSWQTGLLLTVTHSGKTVAAALILFLPSFTVSVFEEMSECCYDLVLVLLAQSLLHFAEYSDRELLRKNVSPTSLAFLCVS